MAVAALKLPAENGLEQESNLIEGLEAARLQIEERFLAGGGTVLSILNVLDSLIGSLDQLTSSLDAKTADQTMAELEGAVVRLSQLTELEAARQESFRAILVTQQNLRPHIGQMQETLRYLRTFALTAKIAGAGIPDFAGFAEEILRRIQDGAREVHELSAKLGQLGTGLGPVVDRSETIVQNYRGTIPLIVANLSDGITRITDHHRQLVKHAAAVKKVAERIQTKLASILSAMQIGDMTRQRIEHCQSSFTILDETLTSEIALPLTSFQKEELTQAVRQLVALQLDQITAEFARDTGKIVETVKSFHSDLQEICALRRLMAEGTSGQETNEMRDLEAGIASARSAVQQIEGVAQEAAVLSRTTAATVDDLLTGIGVVQVVRTDIHYMALNTNLRCSRIGEEGKAINVVTAELRNFAVELDETAGNVLQALGELEAAAASLAAQHDSSGDNSLDERLGNALSSIRDAGNKMEIAVDDLSKQSEAAEIKMNQSLAQLDFDAQLGDVLRRCADGLAIDSHCTSVPTPGMVMDLLGSRILKLYTMASERELHAQVFGSDLQEISEPSGSSDDDVFDALF